MIGRQMNGGSWAKVSLKLGELEPADGKPAELQIWFMLDGT
ncbi:MAG: hypothetical protein R3C28_28730 [Pirellulaceae bacterium]